MSLSACDFLDLMLQAGIRRFAFVQKKENF
jgi:hypothetical protein